MPKILITPAAEDDLINIWIYIARDNPEAADRTIKTNRKAAFITLHKSVSVCLS
jgi:plasmid stabilization system protein ParE